MHSEARVGVKKVFVYLYEYIDSFLVYSIYLIEKIDIYKSIKFQANLNFKFW